MGWLWTCLRGGQTIQAHRLSSDRSSPRRSHRGRVCSPSHALRIHQLPVHLSRNGHKTPEKFQRKLRATTGKYAEPEKVGTFKIPASSVSTCISINTLKKASEGHPGSSFRSELGTNLRSDVDELKEELAALQRRLANEEAEGKKLREEVNYLRSCGVLHKSEDSSDFRRTQNLVRPFIGFSEVGEQMKIGGGDAPTKQLRKCFSGPLLFDETLSLSKDLSVAARDLTTHVRLSSHRVGLSPKSQSHLKGGHALKDGKTRQSSRSASEVGPGAPNMQGQMKTRSCKSAHDNTAEHEPSLTLAAWVSQGTQDAATLQGKLEDEDLGAINHAKTIAEPSEVQWIEVQSAPCPSSSSTNVKRNMRTRSKEDANSPKSSTRMRAALAGADALTKDSQRSGGKRRPKRSGDQEPTEKRSKDQPLLPSNINTTIITEQVEAQLSDAVAAFRQHRWELDAKHQSLARGLTSSTNLSSTNVVNLFRNSRKRSLALRSRGFRRALSPVKEALSVEEAAWSRHNSENEWALGSEVLMSCQGPTPRSLQDTVISIIKNQSFEALEGVQSAEFFKVKEEPFQVKEEPFQVNEEPFKVKEESSKVNEAEVSLKGQEDAVAETRVSAEGLVPIQCASPSLSPKKRSASAALDALCALVPNHAVQSPGAGRYGLEDSVEGMFQDTDCDHACEGNEDDYGIDINPIACASPSFSPRKKNSRGPVCQPVNIHQESFSSLLVSIESVEKSPRLILKTSCDLSSQQDSPLEPLRECSSSHEDNEFQHSTDRSWYSDAIDAIKSISDIRSSKERRLSTEAVSKETSPLKPHRQPNARPPQSSSAEKKALRRAFSWYVSQNDERMMMSGLEERETEQKQQSGIEERKEEEDKVLRNSSVMNRLHSVHKPASANKQPRSDANKSAVTNNRTDADTDSGETGTFSIDLNRPACSPRESELCNEGESVDSHRVYSSTRMSQQLEGADKENYGSRDAPTRKSALLASKDFMMPNGSNRQLRRSLDLEDKPILGSVAVHWENLHPTLNPQSWVGIGDPNATDKYKEDQKVKWHATPFEERVERALAKNSDLPPRTLFGVPQKCLVRSGIF